MQNQLITSCIQNKPFTQLEILHIMATFGEIEHVINHFRTIRFKIKHEDFNLIQKNFNNILFSLNFEKINSIMIIYKDM